MSKVKLDERIENAVNAFFDAGTDKEDFAVALSGERALATAESEPPAAKAERWTLAARDILLFGPGSFLLYYATLATIFFYPEFGLSFPGLFLALSGVFLCYAGAGKLTNTRNVVVPATVMAVAVLVAMLAAFFPPDSRSDIYFWYSIFAFPIALIVSKILQSWVKGR